VRARVAARRGCPVIGRVAVPTILLVPAVALLLAAPLLAQQLGLVRVTLSTAAAVDSVRRLGIDVVEVHLAPGAGATLVVVAGPRDRARLAGRGWRVEDIAPAPAVAALEARRVALGARAFTVYRDFDDPARGVAAYLRSLAASRGNVAVDSIGASWQGRPLLAVKVGPAGDSPSRPNVLFVATYHAREWAATEMALRLVAFLADSLAARPGGAALLASRDVWVVPVVNPDGYQYTFGADRLWRKNRRANADGSFGVDLNRNHAGFFAFDDDGSSPTLWSETYRGPSAESEPETSAIALFHRAHPPVAAISYHTYASAVLYPWSHAFGLFTGDQPVFEALAGTVLRPAVRDSVPGSDHSAYVSAPGWTLYPTNGDYDGWAYRELGTLAFTAEITSGCCLGGAYYGFVFPDDEALLQRVFRDNLPFALDLIAAAGDPARAVGPLGTAAAGAAWLSVWPTVVVSAPAGTASLSLDVATGAGAPRSYVLPRDTLGAGRFLARYAVGAAPFAGAEAVRVPQLGLVAEVLARDGAEWEGTPWRGFRRTGDAFEGQFAWTGGRDTLLSPEIRVAGRSGLRLFFWTKHEGSLSDTSSEGRVAVSTDGGRSWTEVGRLVGAGTTWYPVVASLAPAEGAASLRVRFVASGMQWWVDAVTVAAGESRLFDAAATAQGNPLGISANPVRAAPQVLRWPPGQGTARVQVFSFYGTLVAEEVLPADPGLYRWDLTARSGELVANGAYVAVVTLSDGTRYRRRFFVLRNGS
jgi:hypothetical protein